MMNFRKILSKTLVIVFLFALLTAHAADRWLPVVEVPQDAPVNPAFEKYMADRALGLIQYFTADGHALGYIPSPLKLPKADVDPASLPYAVTVLPTSYDLRAHAGVTGVRDQGNCGSCWTFATYASLESYLKFKKASTRNFSEQDMNKNHGFSWAECDGGNRDMSTAYLARWRGPKNETDVPYPWAMPDAPIQAATVQKHVQNVWFIPDRTSYTANTTIKNAVMANGAIYCAFCWNSTYYNAAKGSYYYSGSDSANHAVAIVGWNDGYGKSNFKTPAPYNGAFLVKNSWGTSWGNSGYFWMSYYDTILCEFAQFLSAEPTTILDKIYQYDPLGWCSSFGVGGTVAWAANIFTAGTAANQNRIKAVSFYTTEPNTQVSISIYKNTNTTNPKSGTKVGATVTKTIAHAGYNTVNFSTPYVVTAGNKFSVVVKFTNPTYPYPLASERYYSGYSDGVTSGAGQSFYGTNGTSWTDAYTANPSVKRNFCIKAFAGN